MTCSRLLNQYKSNLADESVARAFVDLETFKREWQVGIARETGYGYYLQSEG